MSAAIRRQVEQVSRSTGAQFTSDEITNYTNAIVNGSLKLTDVQRVGTERAATRARNRERVGVVARNLGLPRDYVNGFIDAFIEMGDVDTALARVRESPDYDRFFPGNRREDGSVRYSEREYQTVVEFYAAKLEDEGVNPDLFASKFGELVAGDVSIDEFRDRVDAIRERVLRAPAEVRQAFAAEFGVADLTPEAILGVALDPTIAEQVRDRRISISQVTGQAQRFGFRRSRERVEALLDAGLSPEQAAGFYTGAATSLGRLGAAAGRTGETFGIGELEEAGLLGSVDRLQQAARLDAQERSAFSRSGSVVGDRTGALTGLDRR